MTTPEHEERIANAVTYKLTGEVRYKSCAAGMGRVAVVIDTMNNFKEVWQGDSMAIADAIAQNMNGLDLDDA